ncbi:unnamed protein product, partial [Schistosoma guineensis]
MRKSNEYISVLFAVVIVFASTHKVNGRYEPAYLETNMVGRDTNTNTFRVIQEQTAAMAFEWKPMKHKNFDYVYLVLNVYLWPDETVRVYKGNIGLLEAIGQPCEASTLRAEGYNTNYFYSNFQTYYMTYKR